MKVNKFLLFRILYSINLNILNSFDFEMFLFSKKSVIYKMQSLEDI